MKLGNLTTDKRCREHHGQPSKVRAHSLGELLSGFWTERTASPGTGVPTSDTPY